MAGDRFNSNLPISKNFSPTSAYATGSTYAAANRWHGPASLPAAQGSLGASSANRLTFWLFTIERPLVVNRIANYCYVGEANSLMRFGIYSVTENGTIGSLLVDYGTVSGATSGTKTASGSTVVWGRFAVGCATSNHTSVRWSGPVSFSAGTFTPYLFGDGIAQNRPSVGWIATGTDYSGGMPDPPPALSIANNNSGVLPMPVVEYA